MQWQSNAKSRGIILNGQMYLAVQTPYFNKSKIVILTRRLSIVLQFYDDPLDYPQAQRTDSQGCGYGCVL